MTIHLQKFVDRVRGQEARGAKDFNMSMQEAKDLHADVTRLLLELESLRKELTQKPLPENQPITVQISGGTFQ